MTKATQLKLLNAGLMINALWLTSCCRPGNQTFEYIMKKRSKLTKDVGQVC